MPSDLARSERSLGELSFAAKRVSMISMWAARHLIRFSDIPLP
jgi:hypothetical protein